MSYNVPASFQVKFKNNLEMALQEQGDPFAGAVTMQDDASAEKIKIKDIIGNNAALRATERHGDTRYNNTSFDGVWLAKPDEYYDADLIDNADKLATAIDLQGATTMSIMGTIRRARIEAILAGFYGNIVSGKEGTTTTPFPAGNEVAVTVGGASGAQKMNTKKLRAANVMLSEAYVDISMPRYMVLTAEDNDALLGEIPATSSDFKGAFGGVFENGFIKQLLGWTFIPVELDNPMLGAVPALATNGSGYRRNPFWVKPGLVVNYWQRLRTMVDPLPQKLGSIQVLAGTTLAATRTQPGMSGVILNEKG